MTITAMRELDAPYGIERSPDGKLIDRYPLLRERYGPDNPGKTPKERNLFAQGALWWAGQITKSGADDVV